MEDRGECEVIEPRWYYASFADSERWFLGGDTRAAAIETAKLRYSQCETGAPFVVAPEVVVPDVTFWRAVASAILDHGVGECADESLAEENLIDYEDGWLGQMATWKGPHAGPRTMERRRTLEDKFAEVLAQVLERPRWAEIATGLAEAVKAPE